MRERCLSGYACGSWLARGGHYCTHFLYSSRLVIRSAYFTHLHFHSAPSRYGFTRMPSTLYRSIQRYLCTLISERDSKLPTERAGDGFGAFDGTVGWTTDPARL